MCEKSRIARLSALWLLLVMATRLEASAQTIAPEAPTHSPSVAIVGLTGLKTEATPGTFIGGVHYGVPLKWSGLIAASYPLGSDESRAFLAAEPGIGGWRASVGYLRMTSNLGSGYSARASLLRTNNRAWRVAPQSTFAGAEFQFMPLFMLGARVGAFLRIGGQGQRGLLTADASLVL
jgi:hypothetical protein